jgi:hypothetical protein
LGVNERELDVKIRKGLYLGEESKEFILECF